jgi:predicted Zn-dependent protease
MNNLKRLAVLVSLCAWVSVAPAQQQPQQVVQDGIAVKPLSGWQTATRMLAPREAVEQQSAQQYQALVAQARQEGALVPTDNPQVQRLRAIAQRIIPHTARWNPDAASWKWQVNLLNSKQVNAFCMPGGRIAFYTGILNSLNLTDDEVAAVMGHEIAHALREHGRERMGQSAATGLAARLGGVALSAWLGIDPGLTTRATEAVGQLTLLKFSRDEEREADLIGLDIAARAGFDPRAGITLWNKMGALDRNGAPPELLSTHPGGENRIAQIQNHMNVLLPLYARTKGTSVDRLPPYRSNVAVR